MSFFLPAPLPIVVFSLSITTLRARPSMLIVTLSSFMPSSSEISWPPVRIAMSSSIALRRSPKPGALTAATLRPPRSRLTTNVASASPSTSSAMINSGRPDCTTASSTGSIDCSPDSFLLVQQHVDVLEFGCHFLGVGDEIGRQVTTVEFHALDDVDLGFERLVLLDGDDAFIAAPLHRLRDHLADRGVAIGRDGADLGDFGRRGDRLGALLPALDHGMHRNPDAAPPVRQVHAGGN